MLSAFTPRLYPNLAERGVGTQQTTKRPCTDLASRYPTTEPSTKQPPTWSKTVARKRQTSGLEALALGALSAGVRVLTGYPGSPATGLWEAVVELDRSGLAPCGQLLHAEWATNEKVAFEIAFGAAASGLASLVVTKGVGFNVLVDPIMTANLSGVRGGLVIAVGDDPGAAWSQNEQDTRPLAAACQLPVLEPISAELAAETMKSAFALSRRLALPVVVRFTGAFAQDTAALPFALPPDGPGPGDDADDDFPADGRLRATARRAVHLHQELYQKLDEASQLADDSDLNHYCSPGDVGRAVLAVGHVATLFEKAAGQSPPVATGRLTTSFPLPERRLAEFLAPRSEVLVLEEGGAFVETNLRAFVQRRGLEIAVLGKDTAHLPRVGQTTLEHVTDALGFRPSRQPPREPDRSAHAGFCQDCPFVAVFDLLSGLQAEVSAKRARPLFLADPGCAVYADLPPFELLEVKQVLGSSIAIGTGLARALPHRRVVALTGDGAFFHSGLQALIDAASQRAPLGVVILDNASAAMTGFQPTPISLATGGGEGRRPNLMKLVRACGAGRVSQVNSANRRALARRLRQLLFSRRLEVLVVSGRCPSGPEQ